MTTQSQARPLIDILAEIPDFRKRRGKRHPLSAILALACAAMLCGYRGYCAMAEWGRNYGQKLTRALGFTHKKTPCGSTFHTIFKNIDVDLLEAKLGVWAESVLAAMPVPKREEGQEGIALDGKTLRGSRKQGAANAHLLSAVSHRLGLTLGQQAVDDKTNEIPVVQELLENLVLKGRVFTMDALLTQREVAQTIIDGDGDYVMVVKENQPELLQDIRDVFQEPELLADTMKDAETLNDGHGRIEKRRLTASTALLGYSNWPGLQQVFQLERTIIFKKTGERRQDIAYGVTSLSAEQTTPDHLLRFSRQHWHIENKSHWVRDVTFDEDRSQVRSGHIHQAMAALRNTVIGLMRWHGETNIAAACRRLAARPWEALDLIGIPVEN
jgi:predicted transposase YbfD/YdcC